MPQTPGTRSDKVSHSDPPLEPETLCEGEDLGDEEIEDLGDEAAIYLDEDGPAPAASLTSIRLTRRRPPVETRRPASALKRDPSSHDLEPHSKAPQPARHDSPSTEVRAVTSRWSNIVDYWSHLASGRAYPAAPDLDAELIAATWPNAVLLRHHRGDAGLRTAAIYRPTGGSSLGISGGANENGDPPGRRFRIPVLRLA